MRLTDDLANDIPLEINSDLIKGIQQTSDINLLSQIEEKNNQVLDKEELNKSNDSESENDNNYKIKEEKKKCVEEKQVDEIEQENQLIYKAVKIKDTEEMNKKIKYIKKMLNKNGQFYYEIGNFYLNKMIKKSVIVYQIEYIRIVVKKMIFQEILMKKIMNSIVILKNS